MIFLVEAGFPWRIPSGTKRISLSLKLFKKMADEIDLDEILNDELTEFNIEESEFRTAPKI